MIKLVITKMCSYVNHLFINFYFEKGVNSVIDWKIFLQVDI